MLMAQNTFVFVNHVSGNICMVSRHKYNYCRFIRRLEKTVAVMVTALQHAAG
jgi:hypothetical protein